MNVDGLNTAMHSDVADNWFMFGTVASYIALFELLLIFPLQLLGLTMLLKEPRKQVSDFLLIHLTIAEMLVLAYTQADIHHPPSQPLPLSACLYLFVGVLQFQTLFMITIDRYLAVKLALRYQIVVTKRKTFIMLTLIWAVSILICIPSYWYEKVMIVVTSMAANLIGCVLFIVCYTYIIVTVRRRKRKVSKQSVPAGRNNFKYHVPLIIIVTLVCFCTVPDIIWVFGAMDLQWHWVLWNANILADTLTYMFKEMHHSTRSII